MYIVPIATAKLSAAYSKIAQKCFTYKGRQENFQRKKSEQI